MEATQMSINRQMDKNGIVYIHTAMKKNDILPFVTTWMDLEGILVSEVSQRERQIPYDLAYMWNLKKTNK